MPGMHGRYLRIDPRPGRTGCVALEESVLRGFLGGVGLGTWIVAHETPAGAGMYYTRRAAPLRADVRELERIRRSHRSQPVPVQIVEE